MKDSKLINKLPSSFIYTITKQGLEQLRLELPEWYEFYMRYSNNNHPGGNETQKTTSLRVSEIHSLMQICEIKFGPQKPSLENIRNGGEKNKPYDNVFYMLKELKYEKSQREARTSTSRAAGIIFSRGINALVYNCYNTPMKLSKPCERETSHHMVPLSQELFEDGTLRTVNDAIFIAKDDEAALKIVAPFAANYLSQKCRITLSAQQRPSLCSEIIPSLLGYPLPHQATSTLSSQKTL